MSEDKPLHVRVAEALGWTDISLAAHLRRLTFVNGISGSEVYVGRGTEPGDKIDTPQPVPRYDTDWSATGPLIEKYGICLWNEYKGVGDWTAGWGSSETYEGMFFLEEESGPTPLLAVCHLILALKEAGNL